MTVSAAEMGKIWFEKVWNQGHRDVITEMLAPDSILHDGGQDSVGIPPFLQFFDRMQASFTGIHVEVTGTLEVGDEACVRWTCTLKHTGDGLGMPATGKTVKVTGITWIRVQDGKLKESWQNWDMLAMMEQIKEQGTAPTYVI